MGLKDRLNGDLGSPSEERRLGAHLGDDDGNSEERAGLGIAFFKRKLLEEIDLAEMSARRRRAPGAAGARPRPHHQPRGPGALRPPSAPR